ncbi:unnamed protein product [Rotaria sordida]|uniref:Uncharacterized protein n=1 Tax=Rotaria sordida TaxID=392033 RepID=A0A814AMN3_9BILA|nr:unnamed protein product [Rotaria sordida]CAF0995391.1 unnamed protein product [Rotaria sordida]
MEHRKRPPSDDVYIYWKSMDGDVMITLSDQLIGRKDISERIRCLVCYVAKTPLTTTPAYHESYSYLNCGQPDQHFIVKHNLQFAKGSNTFHRGCNVDDFLTYCLRIQMNNGQVTLSHAGPNSKSDDNDRHKEQDEKIACRHGLNCCDKNDANHCSKFSHFDEYGASSFDNIGQHKIECRHGTACRDQNDPGHCSKYSHPHEHRASSSNNMGRHKIECRHGTACRDKNYPGHCSKYSHPDERKYGAMGHSRRIICKHGMACRDIDDADHCSKYSHPNE